MTILGADQLLRLQHEVDGWILAIFDPTRPPAAGALAAQAAGAGNSLAHLFFGSAALTVVAFAASYFIRRALRGRPLHPLLVWTSSAALVLVLAGAAWHARVLTADLEAFRRLTYLR